MKKTTKILALLLVVAMMVGMLAACGGKKEAMTADAFKAAAEAAGMTVEDASATYTDDIFTGAQLATHPDGWQVVFLEIDSAEHAHSYFGIMKSFIEGQKTGAGSSQTTDNGSYAMYSQTNGGMFAYTCQIGGTMVYVPAVFAETYKDAVQAFIKSINY